MKFPRFHPAIAASLCAAALLALVSAPRLHAQDARLANISTRGQVGTGDNQLVGGFVIGGAGKTVLGRAIGLGLAGFGVTGTLTDPVLNLFDSRGAIIATNDN